MKIFSLYVAVLLWLLVSPILILGAETRQIGTAGRDASADSRKIDCYESPRYLIVARDGADGIGTDFLVKYKKIADEKPPCRYTTGHGDFEIKNEWAEYFAGLRDNLLILDSTTGPGPSGLTIWDLEKKRKVYEGAWYDPDIRDRSIVFWKETGKATRDNCPESASWEIQGLGAAIETKVILNLQDFRIAETKEMRCSPRQ